MKTNASPWNLRFAFGHQKGHLRTYLYTCICIKCKSCAFKISGVKFTCETQCHYLWHICIIIGKHSKHLWSELEIDNCHTGIITWDVATWERVPWHFVANFILMSSKFSPNHYPWCLCLCCRGSQVDGLRFVSVMKVELKTHLKS